MNDQRKAIFEQRIEFMQSENVSDVVKDMRHQCAEDLVDRHMPPRAYADQWDTEGLQEEVEKYFNLQLPIKEWAAEDGIANEEILERVLKAADEAYAEKAANTGPELMRRIEKQMLLQTIDQNWREHLHQLDALRSVIGLRGYAQRDPLNEYKSEAFALFESLLDNLRFETTRNLSSSADRTGCARRQPCRVRRKTSRPTAVDPATGPGPVSGDGAPFEHLRPRGPAASRTAAPRINPADPSSWGRVQRNAPCPCGSGKKYKHCHGAIGAETEPR